MKKYKYVFMTSLVVVPFMAMADVELNTNIATTSYVQGAFEELNEQINGEEGVWNKIGSDDGNGDLFSRVANLETAIIDDGNGGGLSIAVGENDGNGDLFSRVANLESDMNDGNGGGLSIAVGENDGNGDLFSRVGNLESSVGNLETAIDDGNGGGIMNELGILNDFVGSDDGNGALVGRVGNLESSVGNLETAIDYKQEVLNDETVVFSGDGSVVTGVSASNGTVTVTMGNVQIPVGDSGGSDGFAGVWIE